MGQVKTLSPERLAEIRRVLEESRKPGCGLVFDKATGQTLGAARLAEVPQERVNAIGKFNQFGGSRRTGRRS